MTPSVCFELVSWFLVVSQNEGTQSETVALIYVWEVTEKVDIVVQVREIRVIES